MYGWRNDANSFVYGTTQHIRVKNVTHLPELLYLPLVRHHHAQLVIAVPYQSAWRHTPIVEHTCKSHDSRHLIVVRTLWSSAHSAKNTTPKLPWPIFLIILYFAIVPLPAVGAPVPLSITVVVLLELLVDIDVDEVGDRPSGPEAIIIDSISLHRLIRW